MLADKSSLVTGWTVTFGNVFIRMTLARFGTRRVMGNVEHTLGKTTAVAAVALRAALVAFGASVLWNLLV